MASHVAVHCGYCGMTPCVGDHCPQWDQGELDDVAYCVDCAVELHYSENYFCGDCRGEDREDDR